VYVNNNPDSLFVLFGSRKNSFFCSTLKKITEYMDDTSLSFILSQLMLSNKHLVQASIANLSQTNQISSPRSIFPGVASDFDGDTFNTFSRGNVIFKMNVNNNLMIFIEREKPKKFLYTYRRKI